MTFWGKSPTLVDTCHSQGNASTLRPAPLRPRGATIRLAIDLLQVRHQFSEQAIAFQASVRRITHLMSSATLSVRSWEPAPAAMEPETNIPSIPVGVCGEYAMEARELSSTVCITIREAAV